MLDQDVVNLAKAIREHETGNRPVAGQSGELASRYQYLPSTWKATAAKYLKDANAPITLENENKATYLKIKDWKDAGYNPAQIASMWNSGKPEWEGKVGVNKQGVKYDVPAYVNSVYSIYKKNKAETAPPEQIDQNKATGQENIPEALSKQAANLPGDFMNFAKGVWDMFNPINTAKNIANIASGVKEMANGKLNPLDVVEEVPSTLSSLVPEFIKKGAEAGASYLASKILPKRNNEFVGKGDVALQEAQKSLIDQPFSQPAQAVLLAEGGLKGLGKGKVADTVISKTGQVVTKPIETVATKGVELTKKTTKYATGQATALSPETITDIIKNPADYSKTAMGDVSRETLASRVAKRMDEVIAEKSDTGAGYDVIRQSAEKVYVPNQTITEIFRKNNIEIKKGQITTSKETVPLSSTDLNQLQKFVNDYGAGGWYSGNAFLNVRSALSELSKYGADKTGNLQRISRDLRDAYDVVGKQKIKGLKNLDETYAPLKKEYETIKKDYFRKDENGQLVFKDGALTKIANATNKGRESVLARLENITPGITREINILKSVQDIEAAGKNKVGAYLRVIPAGLGYVGGGLIGSVIATIIASPGVVVPLLRLFGETLKIKTKVVNAIIDKLETGKKLTSEETEIFYDMVKYMAITSQNK